MDNRSVDIMSEGDGALALALRIAWDGAPGKKATHYRILKLRRKVQYWPGRGEPTTHHSEQLVEDPKGVPTLILLWGEESRSPALPYEHNLQRVTEFVRGWLAFADYGPEPDHDGSNGRGWRVFTDYWGHVAGHHYAIVGIQPVWAMYGK